MFETGRSGAPKRLNIFIFLCAAALFGVLFGTLLFCYISEEKLSELMLTSESFFDRRTGMDFGQVLRSLFCTNALFLATVYILGLCAAGQPFMLLVLIYRAIGYGTAAAALISVGGKDSFVKGAMLILPDAAASLLILILAVRESLTMSGIVLRSLLSSGNERGLREVTKLYSVKLFILLSAAGAAALIQSIITYFYTMFL